MWTTTILCFVFISVCVLGDGGKRTRDKIYYTITDAAFGACFRRLNATHQIGCASSLSGNVGVLHYVEDDESLDWLLNKGPHQPYIALLPPRLFTRDMVNQLHQSGKINGILVIYSNETDGEIPESMSPEKTCPNDALELYADHPSYAHCRNATWNPKGSNMFFQNLPFPIVALKYKDDANFLIKDCYEKFNKPINATGAPREYPLCSAQVKASMDAAVDTPTCLRRGQPRNLSPHTFCDPLSSNNVYAFLHPINSSDSLPLKSVIVASARLDSLSLFDGITPSADSAVSGLVTLLAAAEAIAKVKDSLSDPLDKKILFLFFNGEAFDYIGSSRVVFDMQRGAFPYKLKEGDWGFHPVSPAHIASYLEVSQVGRPQDDNVWVHTDPLSRTDPDINTQVQGLIQLLQNSSEGAGVQIGVPRAGRPLPSASLQSFLKKQNISGAVLTDHQEGFSNEYYHSIYDQASNINMTYPADLPDNQTYDYVTPAAQHLKNVATVMARTLYRLAKGDDAEDVEIEVNETTVTHLLYCFLRDPNCPLFTQTLDPDQIQVMNKRNKAQFSYYVGVGGGNPLSEHVWRTLGLFLGSQMDESVSKKDCRDLSSPYYLHLWTAGEPGSSPSCLQIPANLSVAKSPAFLLIDNGIGYDWSSNQYSSWTESRWPTEAFMVRVFVQPTRLQEVLTLCLGLLFLLGSMFVTFLVNKNAHILFFKPGSLVSRVTTM